jgi:hypothetical protein
VRTGRILRHFRRRLPRWLIKVCRTEKMIMRGFKSEFNRRLIKNRKVYPDKLKTYLLNMQDVRNHADYAVAKIGKNLASRQLGRADEMILYIGKELGE